MMKKIKGIVFIVLNSIKLLCLKLFYFQNIKFHFLNFISPFASVEITNRAKLHLGKRIKIRSGVKIHLRKSAKVSIGENTFINFNSMIVSHEQITIGKNVQIGPNVMIYDHDHDFRSENGIKDMRYKTSPIIIEDNVWIGANSIILRGTIIGESSVVGAGSIVSGFFGKKCIILNQKELLIKEQ